MICCWCLSVIAVAAVARLLLPSLSHELMSSYASVRMCDDNPSTYGRSMRCSRTFNDDFFPVDITSRLTLIFESVCCSSLKQYDPDRSVVWYLRLFLGQSYCNSFHFKFVYKEKASVIALKDLREQRLADGLERVTTILPRRPTDRACDVLGLSSAF